MGLQTYRRKRNFHRTPEPPGVLARQRQQRFVVHEHHASHLHYDFRLEVGGVLKSWAIPKGPSLDPRQKRLAVMVEDHPVAYLTFTGHIAEGNYGAGDVSIWDTGRYELVTPAEPDRQIADGKLSVVLHGKKLRGEFHLVRMGGKSKQWLLMKANDAFASERGAGGAGAGADEVPSRPQTRPRARRVEPGRRGPTADRARAGGVPETLTAGEQSSPIGDATVSLTHLDKLYWPDDGYTKGDLLRYYRAVAPSLLPYLKDRPLILVRYPNGIAAPSFYQHDVDAAPAFVRTFATTAEHGRVVDYVVCENLATLLYLVNLGTIAQHPWHSRTEHPDAPDWVVFDLDPHQAEFAAVREMALRLKDLLDRLGLVSYPKTSGASGMHLYVPLEPLYSYAQVAHFAELVARVAARENPRLATLERSLKKRPAGRIYLDHLQNARGKSVVAPYSVRAQAGAPVSTPLEWREVQHPLHPRDFTLRNVPRRLARRGDPFAPVLTRGQRLGEALEQLAKLLEVPAGKKAPKKGATAKARRHTGASL
jgi:bifunctional non-homologous end joining protein LigD